ncbi:MAG TPA: hypothetical protein VE685_16890 [Thermoanaerobaculia bacterium]|nr:hypothetical protein [Thermoanaerobaculia bacterium]
MNFFRQLPNLSWQAREVVREIDDRPHLVARVEISGTYFPHRAPEPFVRIVQDDREVIESWFADVSDDNRALVGYFPVDVPLRGIAEFGYGDEVMGRVALAEGPQAHGVLRLERERLPEDVVVVSTEHLAERLKHKR